MKDGMSAFFDGDLDPHASAQLLDSLRRDPRLAAKWDEYCLIGDALRGECAGSSDFTARVMAGLEDEPVVLAPVHVRSAGRGGLARSLLPIAASVMGVLAVGWVAHTLSSQPSGGVSMAGLGGARVETVALRPQPVASAVSGDGHREYVFVHQAMNGGGPLPGAIQYVRTVSASQGEGR